MIIPSSQFTVFLTTINTMIGAAYSEAPTFYQDIAETQTMATLQISFGWAGKIAKPRVWNGPRVVVSPNAQMYTVAALPAELTVGIDKFILEDDLHGVYYRTLPDMASQFKRLPDFWIRDMLENSNSQTVGNGGNINPQLGPDGLTAFNTAHLNNIYNSSAGSYSNDLTGGGQTIGGILTGGSFSLTAFITAYEYGRTIKAEDGESQGIKYNKLMVPAQLELEASLILKSMSFAPPAWATITGQVGAADNPIKAWGVDLIVNPLLASGTKWYLFDTTKAFMPLIWCVRTPTEFVQRVNPQDPNVFDNHLLLWGGEFRGTPAFGPTFLFLRSGP